MIATLDDIVESGFSSFLTLYFAQVDGKVHASFPLPKSSFQAERVIAVPRQRLTRRVLKEARWMGHTSEMQGYYLREQTPISLHFSTELGCVVR